MSRNSPIKISSEIHLHTAFGCMQLLYATMEDKEAIILWNGKSLARKSVLLRIQSSCVFSESFKGQDCDCADQLESSLALVRDEDALLIYVYEEGRGAGLLKKIEAISLQQSKNIDTRCAFDELGLKPDERAFLLPIEIIKQLLPADVNIELITNNPHKMDKLSDGGVKVSATRRLIRVGNENVKKYLLEKKAVLGHIIDLDE